MSTIQVDRIIPFSSASVTIEGNVVQADAATTGSNTFVGDQNIQGTITASIAEGFALVGGVGSVSTLVATSSFGGALPSGVVSGSTQISALGFAGTGVANIFTQTQTVSGSAVGARTTYSFNAVQAISASNSSALGVVQITNLDTTLGAGQTKSIAISSNPQRIPVATLAGKDQPSLLGQSPAGLIQIFELQSQGNFTDGTVSFKVPVDISGSVDVSGSVKQTFNAPTAGNQTDLIRLNGAVINGIPFNNVSLNIQDLPDFGNPYKDAFIFEYFANTNYDFGSEFKVNGINAGFATFASGSGGSATSLTRNANIETSDIGNEISKAVVFGNVVELGVYANLDSLTIGRSNITSVISGSVAVEKVLKLGAIDPLPANGVGQLAVSGSNLFYNDGSTWTQIN